MSRCWTCGSLVGNGPSFVCVTCSPLRQQIRSFGEFIDYGTTRTLLGNEAIKSYSNAQIASTIEWAAEELSWQLEQMNQTLASIDNTLKSPIQTQAKEWRETAEELRERGVLDQSEQFFLKSIEAHPLDYRSYVGLARTYLMLKNFEKAILYLKASISYAPIGLIDYRSYSYRLIGHIHSCEGDFNEAASALKTAIELSPTYYVGHYDYAQYCAQTGQNGQCLSSLEIAILGEAIPIGMVRGETNFKPLQAKIDKLLQTNDRRFRDNFYYKTELRKRVKKLSREDQALYYRARSQVEQLLQSPGALQLRETEKAKHCLGLGERQIRQLKGDSDPSKYELIRDRLDKAAYWAVEAKKRVEQSTYNIRKQLEQSIKDARKIDESGEKIKLIRLYHDIAVDFNSLAEYNQNSLVEYSESLDWLMKRSKVAEDIGDRAIIAEAYSRISGEYYRRFRDYDRALEWSLKALKLAEESHDLKVIAEMYEYTGACYLELGNYDQALAFLNKAIDAYKRTGIRGRIKAWQLTMGRIRIARYLSQEKPNWIPY